LHVEPAHAVVSFSVLEHVVNRDAYLEAVAANVRDDGRVYLNYDSGHFTTDADLVERVKTVASHVLARFGSESRYRARVADDEFRTLVDAAGLTVIEAKLFNTDLKRLYPLVPDDRREVFVQSWLAFELGLHELGVETERAAALFRTRNFVLERRRTRPDPR